MYTLRKIYKDGVETNIFLGRSYNVIKSLDSPEEFKKAYETCYNCKSCEDTETYAFITNENGEVIYPLFKNQLNFVMTESGKTFSNLTYK